MYNCRNCTQTEYITRLFARTHTRRRSHHSYVALSVLKAMAAIPWCRTFHVINFSEKDPLINFNAKFVVHWVQMWVSPTWKVWIGRHRHWGCAHSMSWHIVPARTVTCRRRPSDGWFDDECRHAKRRVRRLERAARHVGPLSDRRSPAVQIWRTERRQYFALVRRKRANF